MRNVLSARALAVAMMSAAVPALAHGEELPTRKAGLWELKMEMAGGMLPAMTMQQCTDETTDKAMTTSFGPMQKDSCSRNDVQKTSTGFTVDSECSAGGMALSSHAEISGDFNSAYTVKVTSHHTGGPAAMPRDNNMTVQARWLGACMSDQKPGDMIMPGGMKMNIRDLQAMKNMMKKN
ncbi:MAG: DUF3617 family protein [Pseudomonadota bacterium]|jgi:hypothetical protein